MSRVEFEPYNIVASVLFAFSCGLLFLWLKKRSLLTLEAGLRRENGFDPLSMSSGCPTWIVECMAPLATNPSPSLLQRIEQTRMTDDIDTFTQVIYSLRAWQWRLGMYRLLCASYAWPIWIASMIDVGSNLFGFFTIWNFIGLCLYFSLTSYLSIQEYFNYYRTLTDHHGLKTAHYDCEWTCVKCAFGICGGKQCFSETNARCIRKATWLYLCCELALVLQIFLVVWVVFYPVADREGRRRLENAWGINMHVVNVVILYIDWMLNPVSVLYTVSDRSSSVSDMRDKPLSICELCGSCIARVQLWTMMMVSVVFLWFSYVNHALGSRFVYDNLDPSKSVNALINVLNFLLIMICWFCVLVMDVKCLRKYHSHTQLMEEFFDKHTQLMKEVQI